MPTAVLFPAYDHAAIEERYASWQADLRLRGEGTRLYFYPAGTAARDVAGEVDEEYALVVTDPLVLAARGVAAALQASLGDAEAAVPVSNVPGNPAQSAALPSFYMTLRELETVMEQMRHSGGPVERVAWEGGDPSLYLCRTEMLDRIDAPLTAALDGRQVAIVRSEYAHRWSSMRGQVRDDLLARIPTDARSILEFGCGEGSLGYAIKQRQQCRVAGIELDPDAVAVAKRRIDVVYQGDAAEIVGLLGEQFEWIIGGDIVEHLPDPWSFLGELRRISTPGGHLLLSLPNLASASIVADLLAGRFDYVYMGLACVGHLRFFTRKSIEEMLVISGWTPVEIAPQQLEVTPQAATLMNRLESGGVPFSREDLAAAGYYVVARNG